MNDENKNNEFKWGCSEVMGHDVYWPKHTLPLGICVTGGTGSGKTNRVLLGLFEQLIIDRKSDNVDSKFAALILDPKLSFADRLENVIYAHCQSDDLRFLNGRKSLTINPLNSSLAAEKIAEILSAAVHAGTPMTISSGAAYYEKRATALLGNLIRLVRLSSDVSLRAVSDLLDVIGAGKTLSCAHAEGGDAIKFVRSFMLGDPKEQKMVLDSVHTLLEPYRAHPWKEMFFEGGYFNLDVARDEGRIIVCAFLPDQPNLRSAYYLLKQLWFSTIMQRMDKSICCNRTRYCYYIADEFQQVCGRDSEAEFFAVRREALGCPIVAFQQISQVRSALGDQWETVLGLLTHKIFLRNPDPDTNQYAQKLAGFTLVEQESIQTTGGFLGLFREETSRTVSLQEVPRLPADYLFSLPDGDAVLLSEKRRLLWFPAFGRTLEWEKMHRYQHWPKHPYLKPPNDYFHSE